ncbi:hypothetical protein SCHPADRAFT_817126 [Schizopora paradoxa]|uniref:RING-type E3 ubiquitin transferase n=1 Tax=Schizopora paradoxa TaxID=27342 RepID=A0A0H2S7V9_9AGAM|nr:hypothetical protein SCHPADRAFT_817126 [Schizopora paradoxa]
MTSAQGSESLVLPQFPNAQQAQIIRAHQRDFFYASSLKEQTENILRSWFGSRWLMRWDKEVDLLSKLVYHGFTTGQAIQSLGEEYTDIWSTSTTDGGFPSPRRRAALIFLPAFPAYLLSRLGTKLTTRSSRFAKLVHQLPTILDVVSEVNLALFYFRGVYYDISKRLIGIHFVSSIAENPNVRPPSYSLLGVLIALRLLHRLSSLFRSSKPLPPKSELEGTLLMLKTEKTQALRDPTLASIDETLVTTILANPPDDSAPPVPAEEDDYTALRFGSISEAERARRSCSLCLEERTASTSTECGHLFCWSCIVGWAKEKAECPLCRQSITLSRILPVYNL